MGPATDAEQAHQTGMETWLTEEEITALVGEMLLAVKTTEAAWALIPPNHRTVGLASS